MDIVYIISHVAITLAAVVSLALRVEHRLTKIETDVTWLKRNVDNMCTGGKNVKQDSKVDQA